MLKRSLVLVLGLLIVAVTVTPAQAAKTYHAENFTVLVNIQPDGSLLVTETVTFQFEGGPFTYVFREIPRTQTDDIQVLDATLDGTVLGPGTNAGQVEIITDDPVSVTWHFGPTSDATHEFGLTYRVVGVIRHDVTADTLIWPAIPAEHEYSINRSLIRIQYPSTLTPLNAPTLEGVAAALETGPGSASFTMPEIEPDTGVSVTSTFPSGSLVNQPPVWQLEQEQSQAATNAALPFGLVAAALTTILGLLGVAGIVQSFRRPKPYAADVEATPLVTTPPGSTAPALVARLIKSGTPFLGTLFDLGQRGVLRIEEGAKKWGSRTFEVVRQPVEAGLAPHEQAFMQALFRKSKHERVALTEIASLAYSQPYTQALDAEIMSAGWLDAPRIQQRNRFLVLTWLGFGIGLAIFLVGLLLSGSSLETRTLGVTLVGGGIGLGLTGFIGAIMVIGISTLTLEGEQQAAAWNRFKGYLHTITRGRELAVGPDIFEGYLPYAAAFGMATEWGKYFQQIGHVPVPEWFESLHSRLDDGSFIAVMAAITAVDTSSAAATSSSSASSGGSSGAG